VPTISDRARFEAMGADLVTFRPIRNREREPFGAGFARKYGLNAIHITPAGNHWYQYPDLEACFAAVKPRVAPGATVYGASMGGYAACTYADHFAPCKALAIAPQFTIHPDVVGGFDRRWGRFARHIAFRADHAQVAQLAHLYIIHDPTSPDAPHVRMIAERAAHATVVEVPGGGHKVTQALADAGGLSQLALAVIRGEPTEEELSALIRAEVADGALHHRMAATEDPVRREQHLREGVERFPDDVKLRFALATCLHASGKRREARPHYEQVIRQQPQRTAYWQRYLRLCRQLRVPPDPALGPAPALRQGRAARARLR
jgi:hypothetical protein